MDHADLLHASKREPPPLKKENESTFLVACGQVYQACLNVGRLCRDAND